MFIDGIGFANVLVVAALGTEKRFRWVKGHNVMNLLAGALRGNQVDVVEKVGYWWPKRPPPNLRDFGTTPRQGSTSPIPVLNRLPREDLLYPLDIYPHLLCTFPRPFLSATLSDVNFLHIIDDSTHRSELCCTPERS